MVGRKQSIQLILGSGALLLALLASFWLAAGTQAPGGPSREMAPARAVSGANGSASGQADAPPEGKVLTGDGPLVILPVKFDVSPPMRDVVAPPQPAELHLEPKAPLPPALQGNPDASLADFAEIYQDWHGGLDSINAPFFNQDTLPNITGYYPPDVEGDVGPNHIVVWNNVDWAVYDKSGNMAAGWPKAGNSFWSGFGGDCETRNDGDPIVMYDHLADRWFVSQFAVRNPFYQCIAVSTSPDPTGTWYRYAYLWPNSKWNDYPHFGLWPDGYYLTVNQFNSSGTSWQGVGVAAYDRAKMLLGQSAQMIYFDLYSTNANWFGQLPADLEGDPPPAGTCNPFLEWGEASVFGSDSVAIWNFCVDWTTPSNSTFGTGKPGQPNWVLPTANVDSDICTATREQCIPQLNTCTTVRLEALSDRLMWRVQYRLMDGYAAMVANHTVDTNNPAGRSGIHWFELRNSGGGWALYQQGVYGPPDGLNRWTGSIAMDPAGNIGLLYTVSSASTYPGIRYVGRLATDPVGTLPQAEQIVVNGTGCQTGTGARWGDYASLSMDTGLNACDFWGVHEYVKTTGGATWQTRYAAFNFDECSVTDFTLDATPDSLDVCAPANAVYNVNVGSVNGYINPVTLSASGRPGGTTQSFVPNPVNPAGSSTYTIGNTGAAAAGTYNITISGSGSGSAGHQDTVVLNLSTAAPGSLTLLAPADGATGVAMPTTFDWNDVTNAMRYEIEVATDPDFSNIVASAAGLTASTYTPPGAALVSDTVYYWRVRAINGCGTVASPTRAFRTAAPPACSELLLEPGFEGGQNSAWSESSTGDFAVVDPTYPRTGTYAAWMGGARNETAQVWQSVNINPSASSVTLNYWYWVSSSKSGCDAGERAEVRINGTPVRTVQMCSTTNTGGYVAAAAVNLGSYSGATELRFWADTDAQTPHSSFLVDDISIQQCLAVTPVSADYSDLAASYGVAWHTGNGALRLGSTWSADTNFLGPDASDDGVTLLSWAAGQQATVRVNVQGTPTYGRWGRIWFDWNGDGVFGDLGDGERVYNGVLVNGDNNILVNVPAGLSQPVNYRVRLYDSAGSPLGPEARDPGGYDGVAGGEVEDYTAPAPTAVKLVSFAGRPAAGGVLVTWETASELDNVGFNLYRSTTLDERGVQLNEELIPSAAPGGDGGAAYEFLDAGAASGVAYYYTLEDVDVFGQRTAHGPIMVTLWRAYLPVVSLARR